MSPIATGNYPTTLEAADAPAGSRWQRVRRILEIASSVGEIVMSLRDRPTARDWLGLSLRTVNLIDKIRGEIVAAKSSQAVPIHFFSGDRWRTLPGLLSPYVVNASDDRAMHGLGWDGNPESERAVTATIGDHRVGWLAGKDWKTENRKPGDHRSVFLEVDPDVADSADAMDEVWRVIGEHIWTSVGSRQLLYSGPTELPTADPSDGWTYIESPHAVEVRERVASFVQAGMHRGVVFNGHPGSGKSSFARRIAEQLGFRIIRAPGAAMTVAVRNGEAALFLSEALRLYRPDALIIDDMDRCIEHGHQIANLISILDDAARYCRLTICTVNGLERLPGALLRPGRIDDVIAFGPPDRATVETLLGGDLADLADLVDGLPIVYVVEFAKRCRVLGREAATGEIEVLRKQFADVSRRNEREDEWE